MDIFNNREISIGIWSAIIITWGFTEPSIRKAAYEVLKALTAWKLLTILGLMTAYVSLLVYGLYEFGIWNIAQLKNTILWSGSVAAVSLFRVNKITPDPDYFRDAIKDILKVVVVLEFIIAFYTFPLWAEFFIVPLTAIIIIFHAFAQSDKKYLVVEKFLDICLFMIGGTLIAYSTYKLFLDFDSFAKVQTLADFSLPPLMSLLYMPFLFVMALYISYETNFVRLQIFIKDPTLRIYAKFRAIFEFHFRIKLLKRWARDIAINRPENRNDIDNTFREVKKLWAREHNPEEVPFERGWSPYIASSFLKSEELVPNDYHRTSRGHYERWIACTPYLFITEGILGNSVAFYIEGNETAATMLKLVLNVNIPDEASEARYRYRDITKVLFRKALHQEMPPEIEAKIISEADTDIIFDGVKLSLGKEQWPNGFTLIFSLIHPADIFE